MEEICSIQEDLEQLINESSKLPNAAISVTLQKLNNRLHELKKHVLEQSYS